jgi:thiol-disulfide isomerase/thioredoxin
MPPLLTLLAIAPNGLRSVTGPELVEEIRRSKEETVLVALWSTYCGPCLEEMPILLEVEKAYAGRVRLMLVSTDFEASRPEAEKVVLDLGVKEAFIKRGKDEPFMAAVHPKWNGMLPASVLFDRMGRPLRLIEGSISSEELTRMIDERLKDLAAR